MESKPAVPYELPVHLEAQCSDKILMHINRPSNFQQTIELSLQDLDCGNFTDISLFCDSGKPLKMHGLLLSAASSFLGHIFNSTFSPNLEHTVLLPDVEEEALTSLCQLLYGNSIILQRSKLNDLYSLLDLLCIQLSLSISQEVDDPGDYALYHDETVDENEDAKILNIDVKNDIPDSAYSVAEETVNTSSEVCERGDDSEKELPICCWHCNQELLNFSQLSEHVKLVHGGSQGRVSVRRHHRCPRCGTVLHSMWKLRQHLATHHVGNTSSYVGNVDHQYGRQRDPSSGPGVQVRKDGVQGDHGYATSTESVVCNEHSYGSVRESKDIHRGLEEGEVAGPQMSDHIYSAIHVKEDKPEEIVEQNGGDHPYSQLKERSSPRFRKILPKHDENTPQAQNDFNGHLYEKTIHSKGNNFSCHACDKSFPQAYRLKRHIREVHDKEKLFKCGKCDKEFFKSTSLVRHKISVHDKLRPFTCPSCGSGFKEKGALKYHMKKRVCDNIASSK